MEEYTKIIDVEASMKKREKEAEWKRALENQTITSYGDR